MLCKKKSPKSTPSVKLILALLLIVFALQTTAAALPPANQWVPKNAVISIEVSDSKKIIDLFAGKEATAAAKALPAYKSLMASPQSQELLALLGFIEGELETDWRTGLAKLTGGGITFAVCPADIVVLIIDTQDERMLNKLHDFFLNNSRNNPLAGEIDDIKDVRAWTFDGKEAHAIIGKRLVFANSVDGLKTVLALRDKDADQNLTSKPAYQAAKKAAGPDSAAAIFAELAILKYIPDISALLQSTSDNPLAALAFAGIAEAVKNSTWLGCGLDVEDNALILRTSLDGKADNPNSSAAFALPNRPGQGAMPNLSVPRQLASMSLYRDLHEFYASKDELFPERTGGLIFFENMMGIFFSGRDLTNEVLAQTKPQVRIVVAEQEYDSAIGTPQVELPAFAIVLKLKDEKEFDIVAEEAWQKAVGLINFTRGQQAMPGLIIDRPTQGDTRFTVAYFSTVDIEDKTQLDQRFNFRPSIAMPHDYLILSSADGLARDLVDALSKETKANTGPIPDAHSLLQINAGQVASILQANREGLITGDMVKKGTTREQAEASTDLMISIIELAKELKFSIATHQDLTQAQLELKLDF